MNRNGMDSDGFGVSPVAGGGRRDFFSGELLEMSVDGPNASRPVTSRADSAIQKKPWDEECQQCKAAGGGKICSECGTQLCTFDIVSGRHTCNMQTGRCVICTFFSVEVALDKQRRRLAASTHGH